MDCSDLSSSPFERGGETESDSNFRLIRVCEEKVVGTRDITLRRCLGDPNTKDERRESQKKRDRDTSQIGASKAKALSKHSRY